MEETYFPVGKDITIVPAGSVVAVKVVTAKPPSAFTKRALRAWNWTAGKLRDIKDTYLESIDRAREGDQFWWTIYFDAETEQSVREWGDQVEQRIQTFGGEIKEVSTSVLRGAAHEVGAGIGAGLEGAAGEVGAGTMLRLTLVLAAIVAVYAAVRETI